MYLFVRANKANSNHLSILSSFFFLSLSQATQMAKVRKYESFDAAEYVNYVLETAKAKPIPRVWKGKRLPQFLIKDLMEKEKFKKIKNMQEIQEREELKKIKNNYKNTLWSAIAVRQNEDTLVQSVVLLNIIKIVQMTSTQCR